MEWIFYSDWASLVAASSSSSDLRRVVESCLVAAARSRSKKKQAPETNQGCQVTENRTYFPYSKESQLSPTCAINFCRKQRALKLFWKIPLTLARVTAFKLDSGGSNYGLLTETSGECRYIFLPLATLIRFKKSFRREPRICQLNKEELRRVFSILKVQIWFFFKFRNGNSNVHQREPKHDLGQANLDLKQPTAIFETAEVSEWKWHFAAAIRTNDTSYYAILDM